MLKLARYQARGRISENQKNMKITCNNIEGVNECVYDYPVLENGVSYNPVVSPEASAIFIILLIFYFSFMVERIFFYSISRQRKARYDDI